MEKKQGIQTLLLMLSFRGMRDAKELRFRGIVFAKWEMTRKTEESQRHIGKPSKRREVIVIHD